MNEHNGMTFSVPQSGSHWMCWPSISLLISPSGSPSPAVSVQRPGGSRESGPRPRQDGSICPGEVRPDPGGQAGGLESRKNVGGLTFQSWDRTQCVAIGQIQVAEAAWPQAGTGQMPDLSRANQGTEPIGHTEVKMDRSQNTTPSELNHRGRRSAIVSRTELFEDTRLSLQASTFSFLPAQPFISFI